MNGDFDGYDSWLNRQDEQYYADNEPDEEPPANDTHPDDNDPCKNGHDWDRGLLFKSCKRCGMIAAA